MSGGFIVKVDTVVLDIHFQHLVIGTVLEDQLFDQEECFFMLDMLTHLNNSTPSVRGKLLLTIVALHIKFNKFSNESLFHLCLIVELFLNCHFHLQTLRMRLSPDKSSFNDLGSTKSSYLFQQYWQQFLAVSVTRNPWRTHIPVTKSTEVDDRFLGDTQCNICFAKSAGLADVTNGR